MEYRYTSIMLRKREVGETDRFYTFLTREQGKVTAIAKGVRKAEAKLASSLETATLSEIMVARTRGAGKITGAVLEQSYPALHQSYVFLREVTCFLLLVDRLVEPEEQDEHLFTLVRNYLELVEHDVAGTKTEYLARLLTEAAAFQLFALLGYRFELNRCSISKSRLISGERFFMSFEAGGIVSSAQVHNVRDAQPISENAIKALRLFVSQPLEKISKIAADESTLDELFRFRTGYERWIRD